MCINTYSLIERVCVEYPSYILSVLPLILRYRWKNVIRIEVIDSWQGLGEDVSHVEARRHMMNLDVSFLQVILGPFDFEVDVFGP